MKPIKLFVQTKTERYPILIGRNLISKLPNLLKKNSITFKKCLIVIDKNIPRKSVIRIIKSFKNIDAHKFEFYANEKKKN